MGIWNDFALLARSSSATGVLPEERATLSQWVLFANATLAPGIFTETTRERELPQLLTPLNKYSHPCKKPTLVSSPATLLPCFQSSDSAYLHRQSRSIDRL